MKEDKIKRCLDDLLKEGDEKMKNLFGLESALKQLLWDAQVSDDDFNEVFTGAVILMRKCVESEDYKKQLYEINLSEYSE